MLDDVGTDLSPHPPHHTSLRLFKLFFDDAFADMVVGYTRLHGHREKPDTSFEINNAMFLLLLGMLLLSRCHKVPDRKKYWKSTTNTFVLAMLDSITGNMFKGIPGNAHCRDNG